MDQTPAWLNALREALPGQVEDGEVWRGIYATDASHYQIVPRAVVVPRDEAAVYTVLRIASAHQVPVTARGAGTSLSGQTHGPGIVLDLSEHFSRILEIRPDEGWARVQPGVVRDHLDAEAARHGLQFAPDPATGNRATVGGMIGNNSAGTHSIRYGMTSEHVLELKVALANGTVAELAPGQAPGHLREGLLQVVEPRRDLIRARFPKTLRRVGGYALDAFLDDPESWNLARLLCGSEGTLAVVLEAKVRLVPRPAATALVAAHYARLGDALKSVEPIVAHAPLAVELMDGVVIREARRNATTRHLAGFIDGEPETILLIEMDGPTPEDAEASARRVAEELRAAGQGTAWPVITDPAAQARVWEVRKLGLGLITNTPGPRKGMAFIEDAAIPLPHLAAYISQVLEICRREEVPVSLYAHASVGLLHVRPMLDLHLPEDVARMKRIADAAFALCQAYGGAWSGEHGDGLVRGEFIERAFGHELTRAFREVKALFDPQGILNPGKIVEPPGMTEHLRYHTPGYAEATRAADGMSRFRFRRQGGLTRAIEQCNGVGACRKIGSGVMCPSYMATRCEPDSTRGRANALRLAISGQLAGGDLRAALASDGLHEVLELCLSCRACASECPNEVDMARLKAEALHQRHLARGVSRAARLAATWPDLAARGAGPWAPVFNLLQRSPPARWLMARMGGVDRSRRLPSLARHPAHRAWRGRPSAAGTAGDVVLFVDAYVDACEPRIAEAARTLLEGFGFRVLPVFGGDAQRAAISQGLLDRAARRGETLLRDLDATGDIPILCLEPSCASALAEDLPDLVADAALGERIAARVDMVDRFLARREVAVRAEEGVFLVHGHCHEKAGFGLDHVGRLLPGARVIPAGCCGMAGSFGYRHADLSRTIGEDRLFPAVRAREPGDIVIANGFSCRHQLREECGVEARHVVEVLRPAG